MFKVGDRVLCLVDFVGYELVVFCRPVKGTHYTVREVRGKDAYLLEEVRNIANIPVKGEIVEVAWDHHCFGAARTPGEEKDLGLFTHHLKIEFAPRKRTAQ